MRALPGRASCGLAGRAGGFVGLFPGSPFGFLLLLARLALGLAGLVGLVAVLRRRLGLRGRGDRLWRGGDLGLFPAGLPGLRRGILGTGTAFLGCAAQAVGNNIYLGWNGFKATESQASNCYKMFSWNRALHPMVFLQPDPLILDQI